MKAKKKPKNELPGTKDRGIYLAWAWREWRKKEIGAFDPKTLGANNPEYFLSNRLFNAFGAGADYELARTKKARTP